MLFSGFGSGVGELTVAVLVIIPVAVGLTVPLIITILTPPASIVPKLRLPVHGWKVTPSSIEYCGLSILVGILSVRRTLSASAGPKFETIIV